jgi:recombinational DNA repair protein (RecF pathway)
VKTKVEGILIRKVPYQERHVIGTLLLRSGRSLSVLFYGGQGGGKKHKASTLELGYMMKVELSHTRSTSELHRAKEWLPLWSYEHIRLNYKAFSLLCLYAEIMGELSPQENLHDVHGDFDDTMEGLFRVLSNAVVHLEGRASQKQCDPWSELSIFLGKLLIEQGVFPIRDNCVFCDKILDSQGSLTLVTDHGGFSCGECAEHLVEERGREHLSGIQEGRELWEILGSVANQRYQDLGALKIENPEVLHTLLHYFYYQFHFQPRQFKSLKMIL